MVKNNIEAGVKGKVQRAGKDAGEAGGRDRYHQDLCEPRDQEE